MLNVVAMWRRLLFLLPIILTASSIKVPVDNGETATELITVIQEEPQSTPLYYTKENANLDSYIVRPNSHELEEIYADVEGTPATYLIPPVKEERADFYIPAEPSAQSDWLPILQAQPHSNRNARFQRPPLESIPIFFNLNQPLKQQSTPLPLSVPVPSTQLVPPAIDAVNEFFISKETELHVEKPNQPNQVNNFNLPIYDDRDGQTVNPHLELAEPTLALHLTPPRPQGLNNPTNLYPKKYSGGFKPVSIPIMPYSDDKELQVPKAKPVKFFRPLPNSEIEQFTPSDEKTLYNFKKSEHKRKLKGEENAQEHDGDREEKYSGREPTSDEQDTSATNFKYPGRNVYPAPIRQAPEPSRDASPAAASVPAGRTEFRMHGMKGPHSYQFGYDTGKGKNRQFRYEERDNDGLVHGHYGYMDKLGKLRVVNYSAHPEYGFRAEEPVTKEE